MHLSSLALAQKFPSLARPLQSGTPILGLYFAASWCPDCTGVTPVLQDVFEKSKESSLLEVYYVASDSTEAQMKAYVPSWNCIPFEGDERQNLKKHFGACAAKEVSMLGLKPEERKFGIPTLILLECSSGRILTTGGVADIMGPERDAVLDKWKSLV